MRATEKDFVLAECFDRGRNGCRIAAECRLKRVLGEALQGFLGTLDRYTLADLIEPQGVLADILALPPEDRQRA